jgi:hypothetical protein
MKLTLLTLASTAAFALAVPTATIQKRADYCGQWDSQISGPYTIYNVRRHERKVTSEEADEISEPLGQSRRNIRLAMYRR